MSNESNVEVQNRQLIERHFEEFVNRRDLGAIDRNMAPDFQDHDGPGGVTASREIDRTMMAAMYDRFPDLRIVLKDILSQGDKVVVRAVWTGTDTGSGKRMQMRGFVLWRIRDARIAERWATVTAMTEMTSIGPAW